MAKYGDMCKGKTYQVKVLDKDSPGRIMTCLLVKVKKKVKSILVSEELPNKEIIEAWLLADYEVASIQEVITPQK